jgi:hypothetical protein
MLTGERMMAGTRQRPRFSRGNTVRQGEGQYAGFPATFQVFSVSSFARLDEVARPGKHEGEASRGGPV